MSRILTVGRDNNLIEDLHMPKISAKMVLQNLGIEDIRKDFEHNLKK